MLNKLKERHFLTKRDVMELMIPYMYVIPKGTVGVLQKPYEYMTGFAFWKRTIPVPNRMVRFPIDTRRTSSSFMFIPLRIVVEAKDTFKEIKNVKQT